jgi:hypothetical protein
VKEVDDELASDVVELVKDCSEWNVAAVEVRRFNTDGDKRLEALEHAFDYNLVVQEGDRKDQHGPLAPLMEGDGRTYPAVVNAAPDEHLRIWAEAHERIENSLVRSRLGDLLWLRRYGDKPHLFARSAISAYRVLAADGSWQPVVQADCLQRALQLSKELNDRDLIAEIVDQALRALAAVVDKPEATPGEVINLLDLLIASPEPPVELDDLLGRAIDRLGEDPWLLQSLVEMQIARSTDPEERKEASARLVARWREVAEKAEGITRVVFLNTALQVAQAAGLPKLADEVRVDLQEITNEDLDLKVISTSVEVESEKVETWLESFMEGDDWRGWLMRFGVHVPLPARTDATLDAIRERMRQHPLTYMFTTVALGPGDVPLKFLETDEDKFLHEVTNDEVMCISVWTNFAVEVLDRFNDRSTPSKEDLIGFFTTELIPEEVAERFAAAFELFRNGLFDESALVALPRIELVIRRAATLLRLPTYREPMGGKPGRFIGLGDLLRLVAGRFGSEDRRQYFLTLLADPMGVNLRNLVLHGLSPKAARPEAALCLHVAIALALMAKREPGSPEDGGPPGP